MNSINAKMLVSFGVGRYEVTVVLPAWQYLYKAKGSKLNAKEDFFDSFWEGLDGSRRQDHEVYAGVQAAVVALPQSYGLPWRLQPSRRLEGQISMVLGTVLVGLGVSAMALWGGPIAWSEGRQVWKNLRVASLSTEEQAEVKVVEQVTFADYVAKDAAIATLTPASHEFSVVIPKIQVNSVVVPQVNANDKTAYMEALKQGLAHAAGTAVPGQPGDTYIFGHSTDYEWNIAAWNALFYNLKELTVGDKVYVWYQGMPKIYQVADTKIYEADDTSFINPDSGAERLLLQTCYPPGTTNKRLVVFAEPAPVAPGLANSL